MALYTIADLHLSFGVDKPMDVFGAAWAHHAAVLEANWRGRIDSADTVVLIGDHSWGLKLQEAVPDLAFLDRLPGRKILLKGNHDLWWPTARRLEALCTQQGWQTLSFLQGSAQTVPDAFGAGYDAVVCGTRGWLCPGDRDYTAADEAVYRRETMRLESALRAGARAAEALEAAGRKAEQVVFLHYPPFGSGEHPETGFTALLRTYRIQRCYFGHLHGRKPGSVQSPLHDAEAPDCRLVSGDYVGFVPQRIDALMPSVCQPCCCCPV